MKKNVFALLCLMSAIGVFPACANDFVLPQAERVRSLDLLPEPPANDSIDFARDKEIYQRTRAEKGGKRWEQARFDADIYSTGSWFENAFGMKISQKETPELYELMRIFIRVEHEIDRSAKEHYKRARPYVYYKTEKKTCAPADEKILRHNGSYPSGHSATGWGMALILAEIAPDRQNDLLKRGYEIGQSRVICGFHWQSDVDAGRLMASAVLASLHGHPQFGKQLEKAKKEIAAIRAKKHCLVKEKPSGQSSLSGIKRE